MNRHIVLPPLSLEGRKKGNCPRRARSWKVVKEGNEGKKEVKEMKEGKRSKGRSEVKEGSEGRKRK